VLQSVAPAQFGFAFVAAKLWPGDLKLVFRGAFTFSIDS
jgi:hypothetical protein